MSLKQHHSLRQALCEAFESLGIVSFGFKEGERCHPDEVGNDLALFLYANMQKKRCRLCHKEVGDDSVSTAVAADSPPGYGCFQFHEKCLNNLPAEVRREAGKINSSFFAGD